MKLNWKRMLAVLCTAVLMLTALPMLGAPSAKADLAKFVYGIVTKNMVNVRSLPDKSGGSLFKIDSGTVVKLDTEAKNIGDW